MNRETTVSLTDFNNTDFSDVDCKTVNDLTAPIKGYINSKIENIKEGIDATCDMLSAVNQEDLVNLENYNQILCVELNSKSKEKVLEAISILEKRPDVLYVGPDYAITTHSATPNDNWVMYFDYYRCGECGAISESVTRPRQITT